MSLHVRRSSASSRKWQRIVARGLVLLTPVCLLLLFELVLRAGAFVWHDFSPYYLFYGFHSYVGRVGVSPWVTDRGGYYKFPPGYVLSNAAGQAGETARINNQGFRGPDFETVKPPGTFRVVCMGESSTFGFHNADDETYPFLLERVFDARRESPRVEVINAGFPYYNTGSILSLLRAELLELKPDVLTLYSAYNDASWPLHVGAATRLANWFQDHSMTYFVMRRTILPDTFVMKWRGRIERRLFGQGPGREAFDAQTSQVVARFRRNVVAIISLAKSNRIPIVLITQPMTSRFDEVKSAAYARTYEEEYREVLRKFTANRDLSPVEFHLLAQHRLVEETVAIAREQNVDLLDYVSIVDRDRRVMASYVHLDAQANAALAAAMKPVIEKYLPQPGQR